MSKHHKSKSVVPDAITELNRFVASMNDVNTLQGKDKVDDKSDTLHARLSKVVKDVDAPQALRVEDMECRAGMMQANKNTTFEDMSDDPRTSELMHTELCRTLKDSNDKNDEAMVDKNDDDPINKARHEEQQFVKRDLSGNVTHQNDYFTATSMRNLISAIFE